MSKVWHGGKGSQRRLEDKKKFDESWDRIKKNNEKLKKQQEKVNRNES